MLTPLKRVRQEKGIRQFRLAQFAKISQSVLSKFELGYERPNADVRYILAKILEVNVDIVFPHEQQKTA